MPFKICATENCYNKAEKNRTLCSCCKQRRYVLNHPLRYIYHNLKGNAKRREKEFTLTFEEFSEFCRKTGYDKLRGKTALSLSIDRKDPCLGYSKGNIRAITLSDNSKLRNGTLTELPEEFRMKEEPAPF